MDKKSKITKENLFVIITTENNQWKVHGVIGTEKDARDYAANQGGVYYSLTSLHDLRKDEISDEKIAMFEGLQDEILQNDIKFLSSDTDRTTVLKCVAYGYSVREMAEKIGKSIGTVQAHLRELERDDLVGNETGPSGERKARSRYLTEKGKKELL